ncbi:MAG: DUF6485 family protein, partial [Candidatus Omnitrophica bacterium]|nr:DUF6485 family protein [Candidatus Omnitrophota bacterium]
QNLQNCNCSYGACDKKGVCCACVLYPRKNGQIPACFFSSQGEKTYDRSIENFIRDK